MLNAMAAFLLPFYLGKFDKIVCNERQRILEKLKQLPENKKKEFESWLDEILYSKDLSLSDGRKAGFAKGLIEILPGFDDPIEDMEEYYS